MSSSFSPERWAYEITHVLNAVLGAEHFPINVTAVAQEYSAHNFPNDPIARIVGDNLPGFDGALYKAPEGKKGWAIFYNNGIRSTGRINFTLGHEFGHIFCTDLFIPMGFVVASRISFNGIPLTARLNIRQTSSPQIY